MNSSVHFYFLRHATNREIKRNMISGIETVEMDFLEKLMNGDVAEEALLDQFTGLTNHQQNEIAENTIQEESLFQNLSEEQLQELHALEVCEIKNDPTTN